jgi:antirestriction protein ArdC/phage/plasmid primase-like uncharacterized protein
MMEQQKKSFPAIVAEELIEQLKAGTAPWQKPWRPGIPFLPMNPTTGKRYKGVNAVRLLGQSRGDSRWMTYKQAKSLGAQVRKGETGTRIMFWQFYEERENDRGEKERVKLERPRVSSAVVFNAEQIDGLPEQKPTPPDWNPVERAENIMALSGANIKHIGENRAYYRPDTDSIYLPEKNQFASSDAYYATALHELGHWTGHESRLARDLAHPFGSTEYAKEELRAEIASMILGDELGIGHDPGQHAAYVKSWINVLENDHLEIFRAAADAEKIHAHVLNFEHVQVLDFRQEQKAKQEDNAMKAEPKTPLANELEQRMRDFDWSYDNSDDAGVGRRGEQEFHSIMDDLRKLAADDPATAASLWDSYARYKARPEFLPQTEAKARFEFVREVVVGEHYERIDTPDKALNFARDAKQVLVELMVQTRDRFRAKTYDEMPLADIELENKLHDMFKPNTTYDWHMLFYKPSKADKAAIDAIVTTFDWRVAQLTAAEKAAIDAEVDAIVDGETVAETETRQLPRTERYYINVPFTEKDEAKELGARWDKPAQSWYVPPGVDVTAFGKWAKEHPEIPAAPTKTDTAEKKPSRVYLAVPYDERTAAKAAGAKWDKEAKCWYVGIKTAEQSEKIKRWLPDNRTAQQDPAMTPREEFAEALVSLGCKVGGEHPIADGGRHRIEIEGDKRGEQSGFYVLHLDGHPAGYIKNNRTGADMKWKAKGYVLDEKAKAKLNAEAASKLAERRAEQAKAHEASAERVSKQMAHLLPITGKKRTPYLENKGIAAHSGIYTDKDGQKTYVPAYDANGKQWTMQYIQEDGTKRFAKDSRKEGCFHPVGGMDALKSAPVIMIAEGIATAASLAEAIGQGTVAAFDSGNLKAVALALHAKFPDKPIVIAGDDDRHLEKTQGVNPGRVKATEAAKAVGGQTVFPVFAPGEQQGDPKGFTDFNDLAQKSALGVEAVRRQVGAVVAAAQQRRAEKVVEQIKTEPKPEQKRRAARIG